MKLKLNELICSWLIFVLLLAPPTRGQANVVYPVLVREDNTLLDADISRFSSHLLTESLLHVRADGLVFRLSSNEMLVDQNAIVQRKLGNSLANDRIKKIKPDGSCVHSTGSIVGVSDSLVALTLCSNGMVSLLLDSFQLGTNGS